jgi:type IV pilus assembly protein PilC
MHTFAYQAIDERGKPVSGEMAAETELSLGQELEGLGLFLVRARATDADKQQAVFKGKIPTRELIDLTHHLIMIFESGIPLIEGLRDIETESPNEELRKVIHDIRLRVEGGETLSQSFAHYPRIFDNSYLNIISAGEASGAVESVLHQLVEHLEWKEQTKGIVVQAMIYPLILLVAIVGLVVVLLTFLLPRIGGVYRKMKIELPKPTQMLLALSDFLVAQWLLLIVLGVGIVLAYMATNKTPRGKLAIDGIKLKIPVFGDLIQKTEAALFCHTLSTLFNAGVALPQALTIVSTVLKNSVMALSVRKTVDDIQGGKAMSEAIRQHGGFQPLVVRMISAGEKTGDLGNALLRVNKFYDREVPLKVKKALSLLEPMLILSSGAVVGFIVFCTLLPIFRLFSAMRGK